MVCRIVNYEQWYGTQVQLRFCLLETSCEQEDCFPSSICVKVNGKMATLPVSARSRRSFSVIKVRVKIETCAILYSLKQL